MMDKCLGMQLLRDPSVKGNLPCFGWFDARTVKIHIEFKL